MSLQAYANLLAFTLVAVIVPHGALCVSKRVFNLHDLDLTGHCCCLTSKVTYDFETPRQLYYRVVFSEWAQI